MCVRRMVGFGCGAAVALLAFTTAVNAGADRRTPEWCCRPTESAVAVIRLRLPGAGLRPGRPASPDAEGRRRGQGH